MFERFVTRFSVEFVAELKALRYGVSLSFDTPRWGENHCRVSDAWLFAAVDVDVAVSVFAVAVDDVFGVNASSFFDRIIGPKSVRIDGQRLLVVVSKQESDGRFVGEFRWDDVPIVRATIDQREHRRFVPVVRSSSTCGQATRARPGVALAALEASRDVDFVGFNRSGQRDRRRVERSRKRSTRRLTVLYERSSSASICRIHVLNRKNT